MMSASVSRISKRLAVGFAFAGVLGLGLAAPADAQNQRTPKGWSYELKDGKPVRKGDRVTNADGSWREEVRQGNCLTIKERSATGEYKETRQCGPR